MSTQEHTQYPNNMFDTSKAMKSPNHATNPLLPLSLLPISISPFGNKAPKGRRSYSWGGEDGVDWLGAAMKRSGSSSESSVEVVGMTGDVAVGVAEEVGGVEDVAASVTTLVASVKGADETGMEFAKEGRTTVGQIGSNVSVVTGRG